MKPRRGTIFVVAGVAAAALAGTVRTAAARGMHGAALRHLLIDVGLAAGVTALAVAAFMPLLARTSLRRPFVAVALVASVAALVNVGVLTLAMAVREQD